MKITNLQTVVTAVVTIDDGSQVFVYVNLKERQVYLPCSESADLISDLAEFTEQVLAEFSTNPVQMKIPKPPSHVIDRISTLQSDSVNLHEEIKERANISER